MATESPISASWVDKTWLQNVLQEVERDPSLLVIDYHAKEMVSKGDHYMSDIQRVSVQLQRDSKKESEIFLIVKKIPQGMEVQKMVAKSNTFPNEIKVFSQVFPRIQDILEGVAPGMFKPFAARHIYSKNEFPYLLIVSDLAREGFRMATRQRGLDLNHCLLVMKTLGRYHAASVAVHNADPMLMESFKESIMTEKSSRDFVQGFLNPSIVSISKMVRSWPEGGETMANKLLKAGDTYCQRLRQQLSPEGNRLNVLSHADLWVNNLLFKYNDVTGNVEDVRMVDFQQVYYSSCAIDLQHFITTSPTFEVRVAHEEDLLREYHKELCSTLQLLGLEKKAITFQELTEEYEKKGVYGFLIAIFDLPHLLADSENVADIENILSGGDQSGLSDNRATNYELVKFMKKFLPIYEKKGYF